MQYHLNFNPRTHIECDLASMISPSSVTYFNPRTHIECDIPITYGLDIASIFQSTHPYRVRHDYKEFSSHPIIFQSTHPYRVRLTKQLHFAIASTDFNPRTHIECDSAMPLSIIPTVNFNPRTHIECDRHI